MRVPSTKFSKLAIFVSREHFKFIKTRVCSTFSLPKLHHQNSITYAPNIVLNNSPQVYYLKFKCYSKDVRENVHNAKKEKEDETKSLFQRFKEMYQNYWYVLVPVHLVTSAAWFGGFYYMAKSGVDIVALLETLNFSEKITGSLKDSSMGYIAISYALYKIATPARYAVTLGGTTISINYLRKWGYIKPVPSKDRLKEIYFEKKDNLMESVRETKEGLKIQKQDIIEDVNKGIKKIKETGSRIKGKTKF